MKRSGRLSTVINSRISRLTVALTSIVTAAFIAFGGLVPVGALDTGTYDCGTYGGGNYDQTDCTDPTTGTGTGTSTGSGSGSTSTGSGSSSTGSGSTSTGSGSSTGTTATTTTTVLLNDFSEYTMLTGKSLPLKQGDVLNFNLKGEKHTITVKSIDANNLVVTIASTPTDVTVPMDQTVSYDVDKDGTPDIAITYSDFASSTTTATAVFRSLGATTSTGTTTTGSGSDNSTGGTVATTSSTNLWWIWLFPAVIGIGLLIWAIVALKRRKAAANNGGSSFGPTPHF